MGPWSEMRSVKPTCFQLKSSGTDVFDTGFHVSSRDKNPLAAVTNGLSFCLCTPCVSSRHTRSRLCQFSLDTKNIRLDLRKKMIMFGFNGHKIWSLEWPLCMLPRRKGWTQEREGRVISTSIYCIYVFLQKLAATVNDGHVADIDWQQH